MRSALKKVTRFALFCPALLLLALVSARAIVPPHEAALPDFDRRANLPGQSSEPKPAQRAALDRLRARVPGAKAELAPFNRAPRWVRAARGFLTGPKGKGQGVSPETAAAFAPNDPHRTVKAFLKEHSALFGHGPEALSSARVQREFVSRHSGLKTTVWEQHLDDIPVFQGLLVTHVTKAEELVGLSSGFQPDSAQAAAAGQLNRARLQAAPPISAQRAIAIAAQNAGQALRVEEVAAVEAQPKGAEKRQRFRAPRLLGDTHAHLVWLPLSDSSLRLCWEVVLTVRAGGRMFRVLIDAETGEAWLRHCLTHHATEASYRVFTSDSPSPFSPAHPAPSTNQPPLSERLLVTTLALNTNASPNGWINDGDNETRGNNVRAHLDRNGDNVPDLPRPQGSPERVFDFPIDFGQPPETHGDASVVQLFYWNNWMHDQLYDLGFTEAAGNFQLDNFGRGGLGNDPVEADAQDGSDVNNANFSTPPDGIPPRMQMFLFTGADPARDGDFDAEVVLHEYTHGLSNRRVGGGAGITAAQTLGMGEGWSDFYALSLLSESGDDVHATYALAGYLSYQLSGLMDNYYFGIRRYPYSTDMTKNPLTFKDIDPSQASEHPEVLRSPLTRGAADQVHNQGEVWCVTLWEARANLIAKHGFVVGNRLILQLVTDGMNLSPPNPNFLEARDAILQADLVNNAGANQAELWRAFAKRGMGFSAYCPPSSGNIGVREAFDLPDDLAVRPQAGFTAKGPVGGPFEPFTQTYALTNVGTNLVLWAAASDVPWLSFSQTNGALAPAQSASVTLSLNPTAETLPAEIYQGTAWFTNMGSGVVQARSVQLRIGQPDLFTELFDTAVNDLDQITLTFTPDGSPSFYSVCRETASALPTDPADGVTVSLTDDSSFMVTLTDTNTVSLYGVATSVFSIGSNGYLTFDRTDSEYNESLAHHFSRRGVAALFDDLNPSAGGTISYKELTNRVAVTYLDLPEYLTQNTNTFQIELFFDGRIRITWLRIDALDGLAGLSQGTGLPPSFLESDLSASRQCAQLLLTLPATITEGAGTLAGQGRVRLPAPAGVDVTVNLASSDTTELTVPANVVVSAGATNAVFDLTAVDDALLDGPRTVTISASAIGYQPGAASLTVTDNETAQLGLMAPAAVTEGDSAFQARVTLSAVPDKDVRIDLLSSDTTELRTPPFILLPADQTSAVFNVTVMDDGELDGSQNVDLTARVANWMDGTARVSVQDNESTNLVLLLPPKTTEGRGTLTNAAAVLIAGSLPTNLVIAIQSSDFSELAVPLETIIPAGKTRAEFNLTVQDDPDIDGVQAVTVTVSAGGFGTAAENIAVFDDESPPQPSNPVPAHLSADVPANASLSWSANLSPPPPQGPGGIAGPIVFDVYFGTSPAPGPESLLGSTTNTTWPLPLLAPLTTYYWRIVAREQGVTEGPLWQFTTRGVDHFDWVPLPPAELAGQPFPVVLTAKDEFGTTVSNFNADVSLSAESLVQPPPSSILISELQVMDPDQVEFVNVSGAPVDLSDWEITVYDYTTWPAPRLRFTIPPGASAGPGEVFRLIEAGTPPGVYPTFFAGTNISWNQETVQNQMAVLLRDAFGQVVDFVCASEAFPAQIADPISIPSEHWGGDPLPAPSFQLVNYQRAGDTDHNDAQDWLLGVPTPTTPHPSLVVPFAGAVLPLALTPPNAGPFVDGAWAGELVIAEPARTVLLRAQDAEGHTGSASLFAVLATNDLALDARAAPDPVSLNTVLTYQIIISNPGPLPAEGVTVTNRLPAGVELVSLVLSQGVCTNVGNEVTCELQSLPAGSNATLTIHVIPRALGALTNLTLVAHAEPDADETNNAAQTVTRVINRPPSVSSIPDQVTDEDTPLRPVFFSVFDAETAPEELLLSASSSEPLLVPQEFVFFSGTGTNRTLTVFPAPDQFGTVTITILLRDGQGSTASESFRLTINPVNDAPVLAAIPDQTVDEETVLTVLCAAFDADAPGDTLSFSLEPGAPEGAVINPVTGVFTWRPAETNGPGTNVFTVRVSDDASLSLSDTQSFVVVVREVNRPPTLDLIADQTLHTGSPLSLRATASDPDVPENALTFQLGPGAPPGLAIDMASGLLTWTPGAAQAGTNLINVLATDNGQPPLSDTLSFLLIVAPEPIVASITVSSGTATIRWNALAGHTYRVQFKNSLDEQSWTDLPGDITADSSTATKDDTPAPATQRFYRVMVAP